MGNEKKIAKIQTLGEKGKVKKLVRLSTSKDPEIRAAAACALGPIHEDEAFNAIVDLVRDPELSVRRAAVIALGENGRKAGGEHVRNIMPLPGNASIEAECREAIAKIIASPER